MKDLVLHLYFIVGSEIMKKAKVLIVFVYKPRFDQLYRTFLYCHIYRENEK